MDDEQFRAYLMKNPHELERVFSSFEQWARDNLHTMPMHQRRQAAQLWATEIGKLYSAEDGETRGDVRPDLVVRCGEEYRGRCGERMARVWTTPFGHVAEIRHAPGHNQTMHILRSAMEAREEGDDKLASIMEHNAGNSYINKVFLEDALDESRLYVGCRRRHGNMDADVRQLIAESDSTRRALTLFPIQWRDNNGYTQY